MTEKMEPGICLCSTARMDMRGIQMLYVEYLHDGGIRIAGESDKRF